MIDLKAIREEMGLNGVEFARRIGASPGQLHDWESGKQALTPRAAGKIERALGITGLVERVAQERLRQMLESAR